MAATGYTPISLYYSTTPSTVAGAGTLVNGETFINITDGKLYYKDNTGTVQLLASKSSASGTFVNPLITGIRETLYSSASGATGTIPFYTLNQAIQWFKGNATANWGLNFTGNATTTLDSLMAAGQSISVTYMASQGGTAYIPVTFFIDGVQYYPKWQGGIAPTAGNPISIDVYTFAIIKDLGSNFTILASQTKFA